MLAGGHITILRHGVPSVIAGRRFFFPLRAAVNDTHLPLTPEDIA